MYEVGGGEMTKHDIIVKTYSLLCFGAVPFFDIECEKFRYSSTGVGHHGIQVTEDLLDKNDIIKQHCDKIADEIFELYKIINEKL